MSKKRAQYSIEFNAKIALAAIHGEETVPQLAARYHIHPTLYLRFLFFNQGVS